MTRLEVTDTELSFLEDLLEHHRHEARMLILKGGVPTSILTKSDRLMVEVRVAKRRREPVRRAGR